jgi:hypothetical protein
MRVIFYALHIPGRLRSHLLDFVPTCLSLTQELSVLIVKDRARAVLVLRFFNDG